MTEMLIYERNDGRPSTILISYPAYYIPSPREVVVTRDGEHGVICLGTIEQI